MEKEIIFKLGVIVGRFESMATAWKSYCDEYGVLYECGDVPKQ